MDGAAQGLGKIVHDEIVPARAPWRYRLRKGQTLRIVDLEGNQSADFLVYNLHDHAERYSAQDTIAAQKNIFLRTGAVLLSNEGAPMMTILATNVAYHDTIGGACSTSTRAATPSTASPCGAAPPASSSGTSPGSNTSRQATRCTAPTGTTFSACRGATAA